jgi:hypothetical protein
MTTLKHAPSLAALGIAKETVIGNPVISFGGTDLGKPVAQLTDFKLKGSKLECTWKFTEEGWESLRKATACVIKVGLSQKMPGVKKGETITVHIKDGFADREVKGVLYHVRKPYKDPEARDYYIREEFAGIPKAA